MFDQLRSAAPLGRRRELFGVDDVISGLYQGLLFRDPDPTGKAGRWRLLEATNGLADLVNGIASSTNGTRSCSRETTCRHWRRGSGRVDGRTRFPCSTSTS